MPSILIVDDEPGVRSALGGVLRDEGYNVDAVDSGEACLERLGRRVFDVVVLDIWLPGMDGLATLARMRERQVDAQVVIISGHGNVESAVRAIKMGAFDFVEKPLSLEKTVLVVRNALRQRHLEAENLALRAKVDAQHTMVGESSGMMRLREQVAMAAPTNGRVLIFGENGTGKELVARNIHALSLRRTGPFVEVNCAAIPEELIESELFGHVRGAFTGAVADRRGKFELAHGGTIFLDEIGDMSLKTQAKVLRVLQEQVMEAVGGSTRIKVDVRVLAATNKDLLAEIKAGRFREDLYFRLNVVPISVPALRERRDDIPLLADHFMAMLAREYGRRAKRFDADAHGGAPALRVARQRARAAQRHRAADDHGAGRARGGARHAVPGSGRRPASSPRGDDGADHAAARRARRLRAPVHPARAGGAAGQHLANRGRARRRAQQSVPEDAIVRHRTAARARRVRSGSVGLLNSSEFHFFHLSPATGSPAPGPLVNPASCSVCSGSGGSAASGTRPTISLSRTGDAAAFGLAFDRLEHAHDRRAVRSSSGSLRPAPVRDVPARPPWPSRRGARRCSGVPRPQSPLPCPSGPSPG